MGVTQRDLNKAGDLLRTRDLPRNDVDSLQKGIASLLVAERQEMLKEVLSYLDKFKDDFESLHEAGK